MDAKYRIVIAIIIIQFALIALVIVAALTSKFIITLREKKQKNAKVKVEEYLIQLINDNAKFSSLKLERHSLDILLSVIKKLDDQLLSPAWQVIRMDMLRSVVLPLARIAALSNDWVQQFYAAQSFELFAEESDQDLITRLVHSEVPIVRLAALRAVILYGSEKAFTDLIHEIQDLPTLSQSIYIQAFANAPISKRPFVAGLLKKSASNHTRLTCYRILLNYPSPHVDWTVNKDIHSPNVNIKLAAIKLLAHTQKEKSIPTLLKNINDENWEVKVVVLNALNRLQVSSAIPEIAKCLHDENWWVSLTAALALKNMGEEGEEELSKASISLDPNAFQAARHVLHQL